MPELPTESSGQIQSIRRSVTLPTKLNPRTQHGSGAPNLGENVIFYHPSAKIVHFAPRALVPIPSSSAPTDFDYPVDTIETLPWRSATERTVATAPLRLENVHGLTVFLKCGNVVHAILKNSQCWCVDGVSKFVLRIRPLTYYRIEIPYETEQDKSLVEDLKVALPTVLRYEVTPCPFKRAFTVEIPEDAMAPRRKRAWKPKARTESLATTPGIAQGSLSDSKSEWPDSASTGEDTDGGTTDDSGFEAKRATTTTSETLAIGDHFPAAVDTFGHSVQTKPGRRSVTETPQTFVSLRAKFDASPTSGRATLSEDQVQETETVKENEQSQAPPNTPAPDAVFDTHESSVTHERRVAKEKHSEGDTVPEDPAPAVTQPPQVVVDGSTLQPGTIHSVIDHAQGHGTPIQRDITISGEEEEFTISEEQSRVGISQEEGLTQEPLSPRLNELDQSARNNLISEDLIPSVQEQPSSNSASVSGDAPDEDDAESEPDLDHEASFSSTPDSFHSAGISSPSDSVSTHTLPEDARDLSKQTQTSPGGRGVPLREKAAQFDSPETTSSPLASNSPDHGVSNKDDTPPASSSFAYYEARAGPSTRSLAIPSDSRRPSQPDAKASSPTTDFNHMSTEFRRRAQATRQREVSPMPPLSAIYQPSQSEETTSILSKALALVLVPPISLFIVLLHITARIVISPALNTSTSESAEGPGTPSKEAVTEDDFSFPLDLEDSSDYDAQITRKLDPWDLD